MQTKESIRRFIMPEEKKQRMSIADWIYLAVSIFAIGAVIMSMFQLAISVETARAQMAEQYKDYE